MAQKLKFGKGTWATKEGSTLSYNDEGGNFKPLPFTTTRNSIATRVNKEGLIEVVGNDIPRIDYTDSADGALLLEPSRTNYVKHSESIDSWTTGFSSLSPNSVTADYAQGPYSNTNADRVQLTINPSNTVSQVFQILAITSGERTVSVWLKSLSGTPTISIIDSYNTAESFKLVTLTNEWVRHTLTFTATGSDFIPQFLLLNGTTSSSADFLAYGFQVESGSYPTSYIPTSGSTVTRQADTANNAGNSEVFNDSEGVLFADVDFLTLTGNDYFGLNDGTNNQRVLIQRTTTNIKAYINTGVELISPISSTINKISVVYKANNYKLYLNGFKVATNTSSSVTPSGLNAFEFELGGGFNLFAYLKTKEIGYYDTALTDLELETLTSYRSLSELVTELNLNTL